MMHQVESISLTMDCMNSLSFDTECIMDNIIDVFLNIIQRNNPNSYYFNVTFSQCLIVQNHYSYANIATWNNDLNIFTKEYIYFPIVINTHYFLIVADIRHNKWYLMIDWGLIVFR